MAPYNFHAKQRQQCLLVGSWQTVCIRKHNPITHLAVVCCGAHKQYIAISLSVTSSRSPKMPQAAVTFCPPSMLLCVCEFPLLYVT